MGGPSRRGLLGVSEDSSPSLSKLAYCLLRDRDLVRLSIWFESLGRKPKLELRLEADDEVRDNDSESARDDLHDTPPIGDGNGVISLIPNN